MNNIPPARHLRSAQRREESTGAVPRRRFLIGFLDDVDADRKATLPRLRLRAFGAFDRHFAAAVKGRRPAAAQRKAPIPSANPLFPTSFPRCRRSLFEETKGEQGGGRATTFIAFLEPWRIKIPFPSPPSIALLKQASSAQRENPASDRSSYFSQRETFVALQTTTFYTTSYPRRSRDTRTRNCDAASRVSARTLVFKFQVFIAAVGRAALASRSREKNPSSNLSRPGPEIPREYEKRERSGD